MHSQALPQSFLPYTVRSLLEVDRVRGSVLLNVLRCKLTDGEYLVGRSQPYSVLYVIRSIPDISCVLALALFDC